MSRGHAERAAAFLGDPAEVERHDRAVWRIRMKRDQQAANVPEWEALRSAAAAIKAHALSRLDRYLEEFERQAKAAGATVHFAVDAAEHNAIVHQLLVERNVTRVVKSKSMLTEECGLNPELERRGIEVTDTDLGERIVQVAREPPSHIVMPAIHKRVRDIGALFHTHFGTDAGCEDPKALTEAARQNLRGTFLSAQAGITGVNFAVAESGTIVVCTNEGNADLGTTLPPLHIACMGLEKVIPGGSELAVFLRLLARSATGQPITAYTSHFRGPRPGGELHIIIVDNGRSALLARRRFRSSLACIRCGACLNTCPVYRRSGGHSYDSVIPGPIGAVTAPARSPDSHRSLPFASSLCGSCSDVCPVHIDLHGQLLAWRAELVDGGHVTVSKRWMMRVLAFAIARPRVFRLGGRVLRLVARLKLPRAWFRDRDLGAMPDHTFLDSLRRNRRE